MNMFEKMIEDIFRVKQFVSVFHTDTGKQVVCISYETDTDSIYTQFGIDTGVSFYLTCKVTDYTPKKGQKLEYNGKKYKIDSFTADSFNLCYKILLRDLTSK